MHLSPLPYISPHSRMTKMHEQKSFKNCIRTSTFSHYDIGQEDRYAKPRKILSTKFSLKYKVSFSNYFGTLSNKFWQILTCSNAFKAEKIWILQNSKEEKKQLSVSKKYGNEVDKIEIKTKKRHFCCLPDHSKMLLFLIKI